MLVAKTMHRLALAVVFAPTVAVAGPFTAGVSLGLTQQKVDAAASPSNTAGVFGRVGLTGRLAAQLELQRVSSADRADLRTASALLVVELADRAGLVPILVAGVGVERASASWGGDTDAHHIEGGLGVEYRASGGLAIGVDARMGGRSLDAQPINTQPLCANNAYCTGGGSSTLQAGEYRSVRATVGIRF